MNPLRRSFLKLLGGAALSVPAEAFAEPIRILPDGDALKPAPVAGRTSPDLQRMLAGLVPGPSMTQNALAAIWLQAPEGASRATTRIVTLDEARAASALAARRMVSPSPRVLPSASARGPDANRIPCFSSPIMYSRCAGRCLAICAGAAPPLESTT